MPAQQIWKRLINVYHLLSIVKPASVQFQSLWTIDNCLFKRNGPAKQQKKILPREGYTIWQTWLRTKNYGWSKCLQTHPPMKHARMALEQVMFPHPAVIETKPALGGHTRTASMRWRQQRESTTRTYKDPSLLAENSCVKISGVWTQSISSWGQVFSDAVISPDLAW